MFGARISLTIGILVQGIYVVIGGMIGVIAGYAGGRVDNLLMRFTDIWFAFPDLLFALVVEHLHLQMHPDKTRLVDLRRGQGGLGFLGFYHRMKESCRLRGRWYLHKWPSARAMKAVGQKVKDLLAPRALLPTSLESRVRVVNPVLRGGGQYFRVGTSTVAFVKVDRYVTLRVAIFLRNKHDWRALGLSGARVHRQRGTAGLYRLAGTRLVHRDRECAPVKRVGEPCAGEPHARFDGGRLETGPGPWRPTRRRGSVGERSPARPGPPRQSPTPPGPSSGLRHRCGRRRRGLVESAGDESPPIRRAPPGKAAPQDCFPLARRRRCAPRPTH